MPAVSLPYDLKQDINISELQSPLVWNGDLITYLTTIINNLHKRVSLVPLREAGGKGDFMPAVNTQIALLLWPGTFPTELGHPISPVLFLCCLSPPDCEIGDRLQIHYLIYFVLTIWDGSRGVEWRWSAGSHTQAVSEWILGHGSGWAHATTLLSQLLRAWGMLEHSDRAFQNCWIFQSTNLVPISASLH